MNLKQLLSSRMDRIKSRWVTAILESYSSETADFVQHIQNPFANPVGASLTKCVQAVTAGLTAGFDEPTLLTAFSEWIKIRAVQEVSPSEAVSFLFLLKDVIREELRGELESSELLNELLHLERELDRLALMAFEIYSANRDRIHELRIRELKRTRFSLLNDKDLFPGGRGLKSTDQRSGGSQ